MNSGHIDSNEAISVNNYSAGGGGVLITYDGVMTMNGGVIENNTSENSGGGISVGGLIFNNTSPSLELNGGTITNNTSASCGGGIYVEANSKAEINKNHTGKIYITNNEAHGGHFGGGGMYVNGGRKGYENGIAYLYNVKVSNNTAKEKGAGIAGCATSNVRLYLTDGGVIYENKCDSAADILVSNIDMSGAPNIFADPKKYISEYMLGGGEYHWKNDINEEVDGDRLETAGVVGLHTDLKDGDADIERANDLAEVFITGNTSNTRGGGIGTNGDIVIGKPVGGALKVTKTVSGSGADKDERFKFKVKLSDETINGTYNDMEFEDGVAEFTLKHGESRVATGLPDGIKYTVEETDSKGYTVTYEGNTGIIEDNRVSEAEFDNYKGGGRHDDPDEPDEPDKPDEPDEPDDTDVPDEPVPLTDVPDEPTPLTTVPDEPVPLTTINDEPVPLDNVPKTGDTSNIVLWSGIMILSALGIMLILCARKAKRR